MRSNVVKTAFAIGTFFYKHDFSIFILSFRTHGNDNKPIVARPQAQSAVWIGACPRIIGLVLAVRGSAIKIKSAPCYPNVLDQAAQRRLTEKVKKEQKGEEDDERKANIKQMYWTVSACVQDFVASFKSSSYLTYRGVR